VVLEGVESAQIFLTTKHENSMAINFGALLFGSIKI
jgi:hypothetical protein